VWGICGIKIQKAHCEGDRFMDVMEFLTKRCDMDEMALVASIARNIWLRRNTYVHGGEFKHPKRLVQEIEDFMQQFRLATAREDEIEEMSKHDNPSPTRWSPPLAGVYKVNWDIALDNLNKKMGAGFVVRDSRGMVCAALRKTFKIFQELVIGEGMAALAAVEFCRDIGLQEILLEGDSLVIVKVLKEQVDSWSRYGHITTDIQWVLRRFRRWDVGHVKRRANEAAHMLAKEALLHEDDRVWLEEVPHSIFNTISLKWLALDVLSLGSSFDISINCLKRFKKKKKSVLNYF
jgi:ribonuclease HI